MANLDDLISCVRAQIDPETVIGLARALIAVPSHTVAGELQAAEVLENFFKEAGIATRRQWVDDVGVNVIATQPGKSEQVALLLNGHLDIVPPSAGMPYPPFDGVIRDNLLWGRGAVDMKGGLAAMACALAALHATGMALDRSVVLSAVASEEQGNRGTAALVREGVRAQWAVVGEATSLDLVIAHKGVDRYRVTVEGRAAHESLPTHGKNAIVAAAQIITALDRNLFPKMKEQSHPFLGHPTYNIGTIQGGISRNTVPDRCTFQIAKRWLPGDSPDAIRAELEETIQAVTTETTISLVREPDMERVAHPPLELSPDHPLPRTLAAAVERVADRAPALCGWPAFTDAALLQDAGIPTVVFGPGDLNLAHSDGECIPLSEVVTAAMAYAAFAVVAANSLSNEVP